MTTVEKTLMNNIRTKRAERGLTVSDLAFGMGANPAQVYCWENGKYFPGVNNLCLLADELDCTVDELLGRGGSNG